MKIRPPIYSIKMTACSFLLDKSVFEKTNEKELCEFVKSHAIILPETLFYECYTSSELPDKKFLKRLYKLVKSGAHVTYQLMQIIAYEGNSLSPCTCIINYSKTNSLHTKGFREEKTISKTKIDEKKKDRSKMAQGIKNLASTIAQKLNNPDYIKEMRRLNLSRKERFCKWAELTDKNDIHNLATESFRKYATDPERFCLSPEWLSWHWAKLLFAMAYEYSYLKLTSTSPKDEDERAEHDLMDIEYLTFLAKCDALLTEDKKLQDLAEVAFPNKKGYSSIQEIHV